ncbi:MAG: ribosome maturation factor RimM [Pseudomonadota bacterium]
MSDKLVILGVILGAHGVRGDVRVKSFTAEPEDIFAYGALLGKDGKPLLSPVSVRPAKTHFIVSPKERRQKEDWDAMKGAELCVDRGVLPETDEDEIYIEDLIGLVVVDEAGAPLGKIKAVLNHGAGDLLEVALEAGGKPVLVPFTIDDVPDVDLETGHVTVATFDLWADQSGKPDDGS